MYIVTILSVELRGSLKKVKKSGIIKCTATVVFEITFT